MMSILYQPGAFTFDVFLVNVQEVERQMEADCATKDIVGALRPFRNSRTRACHQLSQTIAAERWIAARKFRAVLS